MVIGILRRRPSDYKGVGMLTKASPVSTAENEAPAGLPWEWGYYWTSLGMRLLLD